MNKRRRYKVKRRRREKRLARQQRAITARVTEEQHV